MKQFFLYIFWNVVGGSMDGDVAVCLFACENAFAVDEEGSTCWRKKIDVEGAMYSLPSRVQFWVVLFEAAGWCSAQCLALAPVFSLPPFGFRLNQSGCMYQPLLLSLAIVVFCCRACSRPFSFFFFPSRCSWVFTR